MAQGFTRFRRVQVGKQSVLATAVAATRVLPFRGLIIYNPNRTNPDVDTGSLDPTLTPYPLAPEITMSCTGPQSFEDLAIRHSAGIKGGVSPTGPTGGTAYTWTFQAASLTADTFDYYTVETGDDTSDAAGYGTKGLAGEINQMSMELPEDLGPWQVSDDWVFANATYGNRTGALTPPSTEVWAFGADTQFYLDTNAAAIGVTPFTNTVRSATLTVNNNLDLKRYADGSNTRFQVAAYGRGPREITLTVQCEESTAAIAEAITLDDDPVPNRYWKVSMQSQQLAGTAIPYSCNIFLPMRLFEVSNGEIGGNSTITLTYRGYYDTTLTYAYKAIIINQLAALP